MKIAGGFFSLMNLLATGNGGEDPSLRWMMAGGIAGAILSAVAVVYGCKLVFFS